MTPTADKDACGYCRVHLPNPTRFRSGIALCGDCFANRTASELNAAHVFPPGEQS